MMSISFHDRIGGTPAVVKIADDFIKYAREHVGVAFMRKDDPKTPVDNSEEPYNG
jgi:hypothetical protein